MNYIQALKVLREKLDDKSIALEKLAMFQNNTTEQHNRLLLCSSLLRDAADVIRAVVAELEKETE